MSGEVVHFEIPTDDVERARRFYQRAFGWKMTPTPGIEYTLVQTSASGSDGQSARPGAINGGLLRRQAPVTAPTITIRVDDIDEAAKKVEKNGGKMVEPRAPIADGSIGFAAYFRDSEGNLVGLFEPARR